VLGQGQRIIRRDEDPNFMALVLLGLYGQAMLTALSGAPFGEHETARIVRVVVEGIGERHPK
jgi:hypothetical protein